MFCQSTSNSLTTATNDSSKLSARIFTKFISDKKFVGYMGQIYRAQAFLSSKFFCNKQQQKKDRNQKRTKDNKINNNERKESEPEWTYKNWYVVSYLGNNGNSNSRNKIFPCCSSGVFSKYYPLLCHRHYPQKRWSINNCVCFSLPVCSFGTEVAQLLLPGFKEIDGT